MSYPELTPGMVNDAAKYLGYVESTVKDDYHFRDLCARHYGPKLWPRALREAKKEHKLKEEGNNANKAL